MRLSQSFTTKQLIQLYLSVAFAFSTPLYHPPESTLATKSILDATLILKKGLQVSRTLRIRRANAEIPTITRLVRLYNRVSGLIGIGPKGMVSGIRKKEDIYTLIYMQSFGRGQVRFLGKKSKRYLAMDKDGMVYTTPSLNEDSLFNEVLDEGFYHTYESTAYPGYYLGFRKRGFPKKGRRTSPFFKNAMFQIINL